MSIISINKKAAEKPKENLKDKDTFELTNYINNNIKTIEDLEKLVDDNTEVFSHQKAPEYYLSCIEKHGVTTKELYKSLTSITINEKALINRSYVSHFLGSTKTLSRDNLFILAIFGKLTTEETRTLLKYANSRDFYPKDKRDTFIKFIFAQQGNPKYPTPTDLYYAAEEFLAEEKLKPLCNKLPMPIVDESDMPRNFSYDKETVMLDEGILDIESIDDLSIFVKENSDIITSEEILKYNNVSAYMLECAAEIGLSPKEFIDLIFNNYAIEQPSLYHMFNIYGNNNPSTIKGFSRNSIIAFGIIGGFSLEQINRALKYNKSNTLYIRNWRDLYLMFAITHNYSYDKIEEWLYRKGLEPLNKN